MRHAAILLFATSCILPTGEGVVIVHHPLLWAMWAFAVGAPLFFVFRAIDNIGTRRAARRYARLLDEEESKGS